MADGGATRIPPNDLDAEGAVLASCLLERAALDETREILSPEDFYADANRRIYETILELDASGQPPDAVTVASSLRTGGRLEQVGGMAYLAQLSGATPSVANVAAHARLVAQKARQRRLIALCWHYAAEGYGDVGDVDEWAQGLEARVYEQAHAKTEREPAEAMATLVPKSLTAIRERHEAGGKAPGLDTGWRDLTRAVGGWEKELVYIVAGRPGMGKSALMLGACVNAAKAGSFALFVSAEMPKEQLAARALAAEANIRLSSIRSGNVQRGDWSSLTYAAQTLKDIPLMIDYAPGATAGIIRSSVRRASSKMGMRPALIAVDYLQVLRGERLKGDSREAEVAGLMRQMVWIAGEFGCPVLVGSQLNRGVEARSVRDKRPALSDLRESGAIEQDAYGVLMLYRDEYYNKGSDKPGVLEVIIGKLRNGATGTVELAFIGDSTGIANLASAEQQTIADHTGGDTYDDLDDHERRYP